MGIRREPLPVLGCGDDCFQAAAEVGDGAGEDLVMAQPGDGAPFGVVGVEQGRSGLTAQQGCQLPGQLWASSMPVLAP